MCTRTRTKRERPNLPLTTRLDLDVAQRLQQISEATGMPLSVVLEQLVLYALDRAQLTEVTRTALTFREEADDVAPHAR